MSRPQQTQALNPIKFNPFCSTAEASFWIQLSEKKLNELRLEEGPVPITGYYSSCSSGRSDVLDTSFLPLRMRLDHDSFREEVIRNELIHCRGEITVFNTIEALKRCDKNKVLASIQSKILECRNPCEDLTRFTCLCYIDLKKHDVVYWFAFPALATVPGESLCYGDESKGLDAISSEELYTAFDGMRREMMATPPYFLVLNLNSAEHVRCLPFNSKESFLNLSEEERKAVTYAFLDPSTSHHPGWPMRNLIAYLCLCLGLEGQSIPILSFRPRALRRIGPDSTTTRQQRRSSESQSDASLLYQILIPSASIYLWNNSTHKLLGWEPNTRSKMGPRHVSLQTVLSQTHLATQAVNLNLNLMKWRLLPTLDTEMLKQTKCLLLGAGTLGCNVARTLLGWGITHITFVDNGTVSHSNPVRQTLFELQDVGKTKAVAAAQSVLRIAPITSSGIDLSIPMPGHPPLEPSHLSHLSSLIQSHDVVFILTDTRESRWLPTLLTTHHRKLAINAALGLDSFLVIRQAAPTLGCYFCNDVVAPENSTRERTVDQQCTVTRPGLAPIAAALAVELTVSALHAPRKRDEVPDGKDASELGAVPHQIRGSVHTFELKTSVTSPAFRYCTACSERIVEEYAKEEEGFVERVCADPGVLEEITGLKDFRERVDVDVDVDWDEDEDA